MTDLVTSPLSLADYLWHWEATSPDRAFVSDDTGTCHTYGQTAQRVRDRSADLARRGLVGGDRVVVIAENSVGWVETFLAAIASGMIAVPLATRLTTAELDMLLEDSDPGVIVVDATHLPLISGRWSARVSLLSDSLPVGAHSIPAGHSDAPACLTYTSGTTSRPKGVLLSNAGLNRASETYASLFHSSPEMHTIVAVPLCHNTGFIDQLGHALVAGGSVEAHRRFRADAVAEALQTGACSYFIGVPTMYHRIVDHLAGAAPSELAPWLAFGGAPMPSKLIVQLQRLFPRAGLANCYGLSEATSITHINFVTPDATATDVGVAVSGTIDRISATGELLVRSPTTMLGYYGDPAATAAKFEDGWLRTGDLASRDDDGKVRVFGRVDDVINRGGEKVVPLEVEEMLCTHPSIVEAAVVGLADQQYGSIVAAAVVTDNARVVGDLAEFLSGALADYKRPTHVVAVDHLPRNQNGKVVPGEVRELIMRMLEQREAQQ